MVEGSNVSVLWWAQNLSPSKQWQRLIAYPWSVHGAQFKNCATAFAQIDNLRDNLKMRTQIGNLQIALRNLQNAQIGKMRGTYIAVLKVVC